MWSPKCVNVIGFVILVNVRLNHAMTMTEAKNYLLKYGYLKHSSQGTDVETTQALADFQKFAHIHHTGVLDGETIKMMSRPRCGMGDNIASLPATSPLEGVWRKRKLTYDILTNQIGGIGKSKLAEVLNEAANLWTRNIDLSIERGSGDVDIKVLTRNIDGPSNTLAYAYFPNNGDIYMDSSERWALEYSEDFINIRWVIVHELGHSLGLGHNNDSNSVMYPYYQYITPLDGSKSDHEKLMTAYGSKPTPAAADNRVLCQNHAVDALFTQKNNDIILIQQDKYWVLTEILQLKSGPLAISSLFPNLPNPVDVAFTSKDGVTFFMKNNIFYKYERNVQSRKSIISAALRDIPNDINAAFHHRRTKRIYFFKGSTYFLMDTNIKTVNERLVVNGKDISTDWAGVPNNIGAATMLDDNRVLFLKGDQFFIFNMGTNRTEDSGDFFQRFVKCSV